MIINKDGQYYIRDLGFVHTSRVKLDKRSEIQVQKGSIVDLGKVVHYHFDKATHQKVPTAEPSDAFYLMRPSDKAYDIDSEDFPQLRARPTWVSADENVDNIQNEINVCGEPNKYTHTLGRSMKRDIQIKLKAVSADHCQIAFSHEKGWTISERNKDRLSSNGTFIFMKSMQQMNNHVPSDMIPLHDEMVISFVNYELKVSLLQKRKDEMDTQQAEMEAFFANRSQPGNAPSFSPSEPKPAEPTPNYTAEVHPPEETKENPAGDAQPVEEAPKGEAQPEPTKDEIIEGLGATEEELAKAATKIGAVYRGKKARQEVAEKKASTVTGAEGEDKPAEEAPAES